VKNDVTAGDFDVCESCIFHLVTVMGHHAIMICLPSGTSERPQII
jgi:hypothetical protein